MSELSPQAQSLVNTMESLPPGEQQAAVRFLNDRYFPKHDKYKTQIWLLLLTGLFVLGLAAIVATIILEVKDKDGTAVIALASAVIAGVIGLFANPPTS